VEYLYESLEPRVVEDRSIHGWLAFLSGARWRWCWDALAASAARFFFKNGNGELEKSDGEERREAARGDVGSWACI
jgi:hypothetical protein